MDAAQRQLYDQIDDATQRLLGTARAIAEPDLRQPSLLPGWTRGHVVAHLARGADAMRTLLVGVRSGQDRPAYASAEAREAGIERGAAQTAKDLMADLADSAMAPMRWETRERGAFVIAAIVPRSLARARSGLAPR